LACRQQVKVRLTAPRSGIHIPIVIDAREIEPIAGTTGETLPGRADVSVPLLVAVADPIRWTVLERLATQPSCVCNLQEHVPIAANLLSYHLKVLREAGLVTTRRRGRWIDYALARDALDRLRAALPGAAGKEVSS
jgi:ArsR family transcriptional regulator